MRLYLAILAILAATLSCAARNRNSTVKLPPPQPAMERQIQNAIDAGEGDFKLRALQQRVAAEPDNLQIRLELAKLYQDRGSAELALEHYRLAATRFPDSAEVQLLLVKALRQAGLRTEAANSLEAFLKAHPQKSPEFQSWLGIVRDELGQWSDGERAHREALGLDPSLDYLHNNLGYNLLMQGKNDAAAEEFRAALKLNARSTLARNNLGVALANKPEQAVTNWESVSDPASAHNNMAAILIQQGRYAEARKELDLALGYNKNHSAALNNLRLVSQLDGKPAFIPIKPGQTRWGKVKAGLRKVFVSDRDQEDSTLTSASPENRRGL